MRLRRGIEIDEDEAADHFEPDGGECNVFFAKVGNAAHFGSTPQVPLVSVAPRVVRTDDDIPDDAVPCEELVATMLADVVKGTQFAVATTDDIQRRAGDVKDPIGPRLGQFALVADVVPCPPEDALLLGVGQGFVGVPSASRRMG